jgi:hypothetical protein
MTYRICNENRLNSFRYEVCDNEKTNIYTGKKSKAETIPAILCIATCLDAECPFQFICWLYYQNGIHI